MAIDIDDTGRRITFLYRLEDAVAEGNFGMHCASMCGIPSDIVARAGGGRDVGAFRDDWGQRPGRAREETGGTWAGLVE